MRPDQQYPDPEHDQRAAEPAAAQATATGTAHPDTSAQRDPGPAGGGAHPDAGPGTGPRAGTDTRAYPEAPSTSGAGTGSPAGAGAETGARAGAHSEPGTGARDDAGTAARPAPGVEPQGADEQHERLVPADHAAAYGSRWDAVKGTFVDEPRQAVAQADALVGEVLDELETLFREQRRHIEQGLDSDETSTEDLRLALRRYRSFFDRLLAI